jgi:ubiquinone/menaquinone biosynthesis C-methylase UbiE/uncharacterized protein YbaR (Trm112 family)
LKKSITELLICPQCLPDENLLFLNEKISDGEDIIEGTLQCNVCGKIYEISNGVAILDPDYNEEFHKTFQYETFQALSEYLWSHYSDKFETDEKNVAYEKFAQLIEENNGVFLDVGCAVGRFAIEMTNKFSNVIGIDKSYKFIKTARDIVKGNLKNFEIIEEGYLKKEIEFPDLKNYQLDNAEFIVADALRLPFKSEFFSGVSSLNIFDKVPLPEVHINEMDRVLKDRKSQFLISDPFSWSEQVTEKEYWLGGKSEGRFAGRGIDNLEKILKNKNFKIKNRGFIWWKIRNHKNHFELIRSCYIKGEK